VTRSTIDCARRSKEDELLEQLVTGRRDADVLGAAIGGVLVARHESPLHEPVDGARHGGEGEVEVSADELERHLRLLIPQLDQDLELREGEVEVVDRLEEARVAMLHRVPHERAELGGEIGVLWGEIDRDRVIRGRGYRKLLVGSR
jgi:hypothetical protein